jgi:hypothetical protein
VRHLCESAPAREAIQCPVHVGLEVVGDRDVLDAPARRADQMMVMFGQILSELVAAELLVRDDPLDDARLLEGGEIPVDRALRQARRG